MATRNQKRILYVISTLGGGTGTHLVNLLHELDEAAWAAHVLCNGQRVVTPPSHVKLTDDSTPRRWHRFPLAQFREIRRVGQLVKDEQPDLVHTYFIWPILYGRILKKLGVVKHLVENREDLGFNLTSGEYRALRLTADVPDRVICVSEAVRQVVLERENVAPDRTAVIPNGTSIPDEDDGSSAKQTRRELGFDSEHLVVGMVANLNRAVKGVNYFIEALPLIVKQVPRARFLILGDGHERETHQARAAELGVGDRVVFAGFQSEVASYYRAMDLSVLTSLSEGLSITVLESMSYGLPVVATRVGGNPELIVDGETGILVPPRDPQAFAEEVIKLLKDSSFRSSLGRLARQRVQDHFSLPIVTQQYEALYRQVLNPGVGK